MSESKDFFYIANVRLPSERANSLQIAKMCESFAKAGANVCLVAPKRKNNINEDVFSYHKVKNNFKIIYLPSIDLVGKVPKLGFWLQSLTFSISVRKYLKKKYKGSVIYTRDEYLLPFLQRLNCRIFWEAHALPKNIKFYLKYLSKCEKIFVLTKTIKNRLISLGINSTDIYVSPDAVDLSIFDILFSKDKAREKFKLPQDKIILGYTGSLTTKDMDKGVSCILRALSYLPHEILFLAVGGNGEDIKKYKQKTADLVIDERVIFLPKVSQYDLAIYQKAFDILLMSFPNKEHFAYYMSPLKMFEYMSAKRPIITSDLPSIREVLTEKSAIFFRPDDPKDLAEKVSMILCNSKLAEEISERAYLDVQNYSWDKRAKKILEVINF
ncbi:glycosyltransferase [Patescibacteria group bacterium]|nr:glycosyltransferase [Patescibacteria group bacterium]